MKGWTTALLSSTSSTSLTFWADSGSGGARAHSSSVRPLLPGEPPLPPTPLLPDQLFRLFPLQQVQVCSLSSEGKGRRRGGGELEDEMCPFTRRFTLKDSSLVLVIAMPGAGPGLQVRRGECSPQDSQASTISLDTIEQWQPSAGGGGAPQASVDDRITEILVTLNSLSAELANISRARQQESSERLAVESASTTIPKETINENGGESVMTEEAAFQQWRSSCTTVKLNVGGKVFHVSWSLMLQVGGASTYPAHLSGAKLQAGPPCPLLQGR